MSRTRRWCGRVMRGWMGVVVRTILAIVAIVALVVIVLARRALARAMGTGRRG